MSVRASVDDDYAAITAADFGIGPHLETIGTRTAADLRYGPPPEQLADPFLTPEGATVLYGRGGVGKGVVACWLICRLVARARRDDHRLRGPRARMGLAAARPRVTDDELGASTTGRRSARTGRPRPGPVQVVPASSARTANGWAPRTSWSTATASRRRTATRWAASRRPASTSRACPDRPAEPDHRPRHAATRAGSRTARSGRCSSTTSPARLGGRAARRRRRRRRSRPDPVRPARRLPRAPEQEVERPAEGARAVRDLQLLRGRHDRRHDGRTARGRWRTSWRTSCRWTADPPEDPRGDQGGHRQLRPERSMRHCRKRRCTHRHCTKAQDGRRSHERYRGARPGRERRDASCSGRPAIR